MAILGILDFVYWRDTVKMLLNNSNTCYTFHGAHTPVFVIATYLKPFIHDLRGYYQKRILPLSPDQGYSRLSFSYRRMIFLALSPKQSR